MEKFTKSMGSPISEKNKMNIQNPMLDAKASRKRAEVDLQLLANRVALLKAEEAKALQKVNVTKARANDILQIKKRNESMGTDRASTQMLREEHVRQARGRAQATRTLAKKRLEETRKMVSTSKADAAAEKKRDLDSRLQAMNKQILVEEVEKRQKAEEQRRKHDMVKIKAAREKEKKELKAQAEYSAKLQEELARAQEAETLIAQLEAEEAAMMNRLRVAQGSQEAEYSTLKASLDS